MFEKIIVIWVLLSSFEGVTANPGTFTFVVPSSSSGPASEGSVYIGSYAEVPLSTTIPEAILPQIVPFPSPPSLVPSSTPIGLILKRLFDLFDMSITSYQEKAATVEPMQVLPGEELKEALKSEDIKVFQEKSKEGAAPIFEESFFDFEHYYLSAKNITVVDISHYREKIKGAIHMEVFDIYHYKTKEVL